MTARSPPVTDSVYMSTKIRKFGTDFCSSSDLTHLNGSFTHLNRFNPRTGGVYFITPLGGGAIFSPPL